MSTEKIEETVIPDQENDQTNMDPQLEAFLRRAFWWLNRFMILMWRLGLGIWLNDARTSGQIMVLTHIGRKASALNHKIGDNAMKYGTVVKFGINIGQKVLNRCRGFVRVELENNLAFRSIKFNLRIALGCFLCIYGTNRC